MKAFIVTLFNVPQSVEVADRAARSVTRFGLIAHRFPGVWRDDAMQVMADVGLRLGEFDKSWSNTSAVVGNFLAQYAIWQEIADSVPAVVMEHDAVMVGYLPAPAILNADIVTLGRPSFGKIKIPEHPGLQPVFSSRDKIPGAHGYYLTPAGATTLIEKAKEIGVLPVDKFISPLRFPEIREYYPWPIEAHDSFTTIQKTKGCLSKHNYKPGYEIL